MFQIVVVSGSVVSWVRYHLTALDVSSWALSFPFVVAIVSLYWYASEVSPNRDELSPYRVERSECEV